MRPQHPLGTSRTVIMSNHAFIAPDGYVNADLAGWTQSQGIILISPHMGGGPRFTQYIAIMQAGGQSAMPLDGVQRFAYVLDESVTVTVGTDTHTLSQGDFIYLPPNTGHTLTAQSDNTRLMLFEKPYVPSLHTDASPTVITGDAWAGTGDPFMGDEDARLRTLLPTDLAFDMAVNLFTFQPGAALPYVETHIMEHGLYLVEGQGIYRLDDQWYPIQAGDTLWMGSYCPQWFCAIGKTQSTYLYYKDVNRDPLTL